jgi:hypothetical protein
MIFLEEELKLKDERKEALCAELQRQGDKWPSDLKKILSSEERQELIPLIKSRIREESKA